MLMKDDSVYYISDYGLLFGRPVTFIDDILIYG